MKVARVYLRVSTSSQDLARQEQLVDQVRAAGYYIAGVYREKASGARADRPELLRMIADLQPGDVVMAESMDRITRLPLDDAERLIATINATGAVLAIPGLIDLSQVSAGLTGTEKIVMDAMQALLLKLALQVARDNYLQLRDRQRQGIALAKAEHRYTGRKPNSARNASIVALRRAGNSIAQTAALVGCSASHVKNVCKLLKASLV